MTAEFKTPDDQTDKNDADMNASTTDKSNTDLNSPFVSNGSRKISDIPS